MLKTIFVCILIVVSACSSLPKKAETVDSSGWVLWFEEKLANEPGGTVRMLITEDYLRVDNGDEADDFLLYDRQKKIIYNVVVEDETIMELNNSLPEGTIHPELTWRIEQEKSYAQTSRRGEQKSEFRRYFINETACRSVVSISDLLPEVLDALREYRVALSGELSRGLQYQPSDKPCYLGINVLEPIRHLRPGFPVREWDDFGYQRFLKDYQTGIIMPARLFELPPSYNRYSLK